MKRRQSVSPEPKNQLFPADCSQIRQLSVETFRRGGGTRPDVLLIRQGSQMAVLKDQNACAKNFARIFGALLTFREARALRRLQGLSGIPDLICLPDNRSLLMSFVAATPVIQYQQDIDWNVYFQKLSLQIDSMHARGVAHGDLRSPGNVLIDLHGQPVLVDFVAAVCRGHRFNFIAGWFFRKFCEVDRSAVLKLKHRLAADQLTAHERFVLARPQGMLGRVARSLGVFIRNSSRQLFANDKTD